MEAEVGMNIALVHVTIKLLEDNGTFLYKMAGLSGEKSIFALIFSKFTPLLQ